MIALSRGIICEPEQIVIGAGTQSLIRNLMAMQKIDTVVAVEDPGYSRFYTMLKTMGFDVQPIQLDEDGIDIHQIEESRGKISYL